MSGFIGKVLGAFSRKTEPEAASQTAGAMDVDAPSKNSKKRLFADEEDASSDDESTGVPAASGGKESSFGINKEFAERYEHNKKREEKQKLDEKYGNDSDSESSSDDGTEDEDGYLLTEDLDARMSEALQAIKSKDPRVYKTDATFFDAAEAEKAAVAAKAASKDTKEKPVYLRDYHRERLLRGDIGADDDDDDESDDGGASLQPKTYQEEQDDLKQALIDEMNAADDASKDGSDSDSDDDAFIKPKASSKASKAVAASTGIHPSRATRIQISKNDVESADNNPELFLSNFMASRAWVPEGGNNGPGWEAFDSEEDEENVVERAEEFESAYNMRFEDPTKSNEVLKSYSRTVVADRSVRRSEKSGRQRQRDQERERHEAEKQARREERQRLRKIKVDEAHDKLAKIKKAAGIAGRKLTDEEWMSMLDDAWDNDAWENQMKKQFGEEYYAEKDAEMGGKHAGNDSADDEEEEDQEEEEEEDKSSGKKKGDKKKKLPKKPKWDDDIDIKDIIPDFEDDAAPKAALSGSEASGDEEEEGEEEEGDDQPAKRRKTGKDHKKDRAEAKRDARRERARIEALVDRQMALDDPTISAPAGPSTGVNLEGVSGFRYRETSPQAFGLTARDILLAPSDTALNEFAGLKKLATFRDEERKRKDRKKLGKKARLRQWRRDTFGADYAETGPTYGFERFAGGEEAAPSSSKSKGKGKEKEKGKPDASAEGSGKKKRKRSGRPSGKAKEAEKAE
ncbi:ribosome biogenesis protein kri1 [Ophiostoma piceae UAMH 11346]|uniref:Ribosome biogenesis protein kri1 n=1 Tax=Ophiostoma piceae (strain UAMH 11346) TaxID=1262450 RepID=S3BRX4_OPHP1|nr:ribosome biogenesis protein kri1 [Ophiostoma piceae UAMH 11346]